MRKIDLMIAIPVISFLMILTGSAQIKSADVDWNMILRTAQAYFTVPNSDNAYNFFMVLPQTRIPNAWQNAEYDKLVELAFEKLAILERHVLQSDRKAVKLAVRIYSISDAAFSEGLNDILGEFIRVNPKMFLEEIAYLPEFENWLGRGYILCNGGVLGVDQGGSDEQMRTEMELRIKALESVKEAHLVKLRDECIETLRKNIRNYLSL